MRKIVIAIAAVLLIGGATAAHSFGKAELDHPSWVTDQGLEIPGQVPAMLPVLGTPNADGTDNIIGWIDSGDGAPLVYNRRHGGHVIGRMTRSGFRATR